MNTGLYVESSSACCEVVQLIAALAENEDVFDLIEEEKEEVEMEDFVEKLINKSILENTIKNLIALMKNTGWSLHKAMDMNDVSEDLRPAINDWFKENS